MRPRGARLGLGQGFRNAPLESPVKAGAGLEECSSRELREREEAGWGRAGGMFPQSTPLTLEQQQQQRRGSAGGRAPPPHSTPPAPGWLRIRFPCGDQHPADRALGGPGEQAEEEVGEEGGGTAVPFQKNTSPMLCLAATDDGCGETASPP